MNKSTYFLLLLLTLAFSSCEQEEGCLNPLATNYQVSADKDCCCEYPELTLSLFPKIGQEPYSKTLVFQDAAGTITTIEDFNLYLSNFTLLSADGDNSNVRVLERLDDFEDIPDDFVLLKNGSFSYDIGSYITEGNFTGIEFYFGLEPRINTLSPNDFRTHPLAEQDPEMYDASRHEYIYSNLGLLVDRDTLPSRLSLIGDQFYKKVHIPLEFSLEKHQQFDIRLLMRLDHFFSNIDLLNGDENINKQNFVSSIDSVFLWNP